MLLVTFVRSFVVPALALSWFGCGPFCDNEEMRSSRDGATTLSIMTFKITTLSIMTFKITTISIMTQLSIIKT